MASILRNEVHQFLRAPSLVQTASVRWKKPPKWRDPKDPSWIQPLLEKQQRDQDKKAKGEAEATPAMLHMVTRVRQLRGRPYWEKHAIKVLGLEELDVPVVHKNAPNINNLLKTVKHLVKIVPVTFPHGLPQDESDFEHSVLHPDGRLEVKKSLTPLEQRLTSQEDEKEKLWKMDEETVERATRKVLEQFDLSREYFPAKYVYKYNQDGKEHRYFGNSEIGSKERQDWH